MSEEIEEVKKITEEYLKNLGVTQLRIIYANRLNGQWKVIVKYQTPENTENMSMLLINWTTKKVDTFREGILPY